MAIVKVGVTSSGVRYTIHDDCMAMPGTAEYERIAKEQCRIAHSILVEAALRKESEAKACAN